MAGATKISVDFNVNDNSRSLSAFLDRIQPVFEVPTNGSWTIDLTECQYLGPDAAAVLYSAWLEALRLDQSAAIKLPMGPPALRAFCTFSNLCHFIEGGAAADPNHPQSETVPLRRFSGAMWTEPDPVISLVRRSASIETDEEDYLRLCMNEVIQNIDDHAKSEIGGVWCARFVGAAGEVRVAIVDRGLGIEKTLAQRYPKVSSSLQALQCVFEGNYSSKSRKNNMGVGISNLAKIISLKNGNLSIFSGDGLADIRHGKNPGFKKMPFSFPGTGVFFTLSTRGEQDE